MVWTNPEGNQRDITLEKALATSSNMFFLLLVMSRNRQYSEMGKEFWFWKQTGIEIAEGIGLLHQGV